MIPVIYTNLGIIETVSEQTGSPVPMAIANIIKVAAMHRITDTYGPIPYSKIGADGSINTPTTRSRRSTWPSSTSSTRRSPR